MLVLIVILTMPSVLLSYRMVLGHVFPGKTEKQYITDVRDLSILFPYCGPVLVWTLFWRLFSITPYYEQEEDVVYLYLAVYLNCIVFEYRERLIESILSVMVVLGVAYQCYFVGDVFLRRIVFTLCVCSTIRTLESIMNLSYLWMVEFVLLLSVITYHVIQSEQFDVVPYLIGFAVPHAYSGKFRTNMYFSPIDRSSKLNPLSLPMKSDLGRLLGDKRMMTIADDTPPPTPSNASPPPPSSMIPIVPDQPLPPVEALNAVDHNNTDNTDTTMLQKAS